MAVTVCSQVQPSLSLWLEPFLPEMRARGENWASSFDWPFELPPHAQLFLFSPDLQHNDLACQPTSDDDGRDSAAVCDTPRRPVRHPHKRKRTLRGHRIRPGVPAHLPQTSFISNPIKNSGLAESCEGCPNQAICASLPKGPDPDLPLLQSRLATIKHKILVLSGKGGVGKSTFASALSFALAADEDVQVGVMDIDITGPSLPRIMGVDGEQIHESSTGWTPIYVRENLALISTSFLLPTPDTPIIWRGPKKNGMIKQFIKDVDWDQLDFLVIDTPPGTSDEHLSISTFLRQTASLSPHAGEEPVDLGADGALIVTTPQEVALLDVRKELDFCRKAGIRVLGIVENMSGFVCPNCKVQHIPLGCMC